MSYANSIYQALKTICKGLRVTLPYSAARTVVVQYPDVKPVLQPRFRGFHVFEIERCIACEACARACPVNCITVEKTGPRKVDKQRNIAVGGAIAKYEINYTMCLFCGLCIAPCPTKCITMGQIHDASCYNQHDLVVSFVQLAKQGRRALEPIWMKKPNPPIWAKNGDVEHDPEKRDLMAAADDPEFCKKLAEAATPPPKPEKQGNPDA